MIMIFIQPTRYGAGITLWGDPFDLDHIRDTIYACADETIWGEPVAFFLLALAYDVRHACQGDRLEKQFSSDGVDTVTYRGVQILWPYFLVQLGFLRKAAGYQSTTKAQQADIYRLEHETENALISYDASVGDRKSVV